MKVPKEEKLILVEKLKSGEMNIHQVMKEYGVSRSCVYKWLQKSLLPEKPGLQ